MDLVTASIILTIIYVIAMCYGTYILHSKSGNILGAFALAFVIIPGGTYVWVPWVSDMCGWELPTIF
jgi:predicted PurR-regulated permease PerM